MSENENKPDEAPIPQESAPPKRPDPLHIALREFESKEFRDKNEAIKKLGRIKDAKAREKLMDIIKSDNINSRLRVAAMDAMGRKGKSEEFSRLLKTLANDNSQHREVRRCALTHLSRYRDPKLVSTFATGLVDEYRFIRHWSVRGLIKIDDIKATNALITALGDDDEEIRKEVRAHLERLGTEAIPQLVKAVNNPEASKFLRYGVMGLLGHLEDPKSISTLIKALDDGNDRVVTIALRGLAKIGDVTSIQPLIQAFIDKKGKQRLIEDALFRVAQVHQKEVVVALIPLLLEENEEAYSLAANLLNKLGDAYLILGDKAAEPDVDPSLQAAIKKFMKTMK